MLTIGVSIYKLAVGSCIIGESNLTSHKNEMYIGTISFVLLKIRSTIYIYICGTREGLIQDRYLIKYLICHNQLVYFVYQIARNLRFKFMHVDVKASETKRKLKKP